MPSKKKQQSKKLKIVDDGYVVISTKCYNKNMSEIMRLPIKKRKQWKNTLRDKWGQSSSLRFIDGKLVNYSIIHKHYMVVKTLEEITKLLNMGAFNRCSGVNDDLNLALSSGVSEDIVECMLKSKIQSNHTGNHYRNHRVSVPKSVYGNR